MNYITNFEMFLVTKTTKIRSLFFTKQYSRKCFDTAPSLSISPSLHMFL